MHAKLASVLLQHSRRCGVASPVCPPMQSFHGVLWCRPCPSASSKPSCRQLCAHPWEQQVVRIRRSSLKVGRAPRLCSLRLVQGASVVFVCQVRGACLVQLPW